MVTFSESEVNANNNRLFDSKIRKYFANLERLNFRRGNRNRIKEYESVLSLLFFGMKNLKARLNHLPELKLG